MKTININDSLPSLIKSPITKEQLKLYAEASLDNNEIHLNDEIAKKVGLPGVIAHGMLTMAFASEFLYQALIDLEWNTGKIKKMNCRFKSMTFPGDTITIQGKVKTMQKSDDGTITLTCEFEARNQNDNITATGHGTLSSH